MSVTYLHLPAGRDPPFIEGATPYKVVVLDQETPAEWQTLVSEWLVRSGCLFMMAWGPDSSSWDDSVDWASLSEAHYGELPDDKSVMTTWHDDEPIAETFRFAGQWARHPTVSLSQTVIIDVTLAAREGEMLKAYSDAQKET